MTSTSVVKLSAANFILPFNIHYTDVAKLKPKFAKLYDRTVPANTILVGPSGIAKSLSVRAFAQDRKIPVVITDASEDTRRHHLIGSRTIENGSTPFVLGEMANAIHVANEYGQCIYLVEEINALTPQMQKLFNALCEDFGQRVVVSEIGEVLYVKEGAKLWVVGTMNLGIGYGGTYSLNDDLKRRFRMIPLEYPSKVEETKIINDMVKPTPSQDLVAKVLTLASETRNTDAGYRLSPSDVIHIIQDAQYEDPWEALRNVTGKFEGKQREWFQARLNSIFPKK